MQAKAAALAIAAGNRFFRLAARARAVETQVACPFGELDLLLLHLAVEDLRDLETLGREEEEGEAFTPEVQVALGDVLRLGPGLTLGHADVDLLVERANARRASAPVPDEEIAAQDAMSRAMAGDARAVGDRLRALEDRVAEAGSAEAKEAQRAVNRNVLRKVGIVAVAGPALAKRLCRCGRRWAQGCDPPSGGGAWAGLAGGGRDLWGRPWRLVRRVHRPDPRSADRDPRGHRAVERASRAVAGSVGWTPALRVVGGRALMVATFDL